MTTKRLEMILVSFVMAFFLFACSESKAVKPIAKQSAEKAMEVPEDAVAIVGGEPIPKADLEVTLEQVPERRRERLRMRTVYYLVDAKIYSQEAKKIGLHKDPAVQKELDRAEKLILSREFMQRHIQTNIDPSEEEIRAYYDENEDEFIIPEGAKVSRIRMVKKEDAERAQRALNRKVPFREVAMQWSKLVRRRERGTPEWLYKKRMDPKLEKAIFALEVGEVSDAIQVGNEYQIFKVLDKSDEKLVPFEDIKSKIRLRLAQRNKSELMHEYYKKAEVDQNPGNGILVKVGDKVFKEAEIDHILEKVKEDEKDKYRQRWIEYFVDSTVFSEAAEKKGLDENPDIVRRIRLKKQDVLADAFRDRIIEKRIEITDEDIAQEYEDHKEMFTEPLKVKLGLIVTETREKAEEVLKKAKSGTSYSVLARQESIHPSAEALGVITLTDEEGIDPALEKAAMDLEKGELSNIIPMDDGYAILKLFHRQGGLRPLEEVENRIEMVLHRKRMEKERNKYYDKWNVEILAKPTSSQKQSSETKLKRPSESSGESAVSE
mgnify:CR=1 FL=1